MFDSIDFNIFMVSFCLGIMIVYATTPKKTIVHKFPSPDNEDLVVYTDDSNSCYKYVSKEVQCTSKEKAQPIL